MNTCVNTEASEFKALSERSGLSDFLLEVLVADYQDQHQGAWPRLDELPFEWIDTTKALNHFLDLNEHSVTTQENVLQKTKTQSLDEAMEFLRDMYSNLNVDYYTINDKVKITSKPRPNPFKLEQTDPVDFTDLASTVYIGQALEQLEQKAGIVTHYMTAAQLKDFGIINTIPDASTAAAFVFQGEIYVNSDVADVDSKVHELLHVLLGAVKFKNPEAYAQITGVVENLKNYETLLEGFKARTRMDANEEIFVREYAKLLVSNLDPKHPKEYKQSILPQLDENIIYNLNYEMSRVLDTMLDGDNSVRVIPVAERFGSTFRELGEIVNAHNMENNFQSLIDTSMMHRILANKKSELMENGNLREDCN